jgi:hypothetical protein
MPAWRAFACTPQAVRVTRLTGVFPAVPYLSSPYVMRVLRKIVSFIVYAAVFFPTADYRATAWIRAIEVTSTSLDKTLRRRKSRIENERLARHVAMNAMDVEYAEETLKLRVIS